MIKPFTHTQLMAQQVEALRHMHGREYYALLMEQGTGKTLTFIEELLRLYANGDVDGMIVFAPNGVHENWVLAELPAHMPKDVPYVAAYYVSTPNRKERAALEGLYEPRGRGCVSPVRIFAISYDSLLTERGFRAAERFVLTVRCYMVADESQRLKNSDTKRTRRVMNLKKHCPIRRIGTGTAITNSPMDAFSQFELLAPGLLGTESLTAFRAEYCELLPHGHGLMRHLIARMERARGKTMTEAQKELAAPKIIAQDALGRPIYRNLDKLRALIAEHSFRVLKEDCLDLPEKVYETRFFHLSAAQRAVYEKMEEEFRFVLEDGNTLVTSKLVAMGKLRQITSGFILLRDGTVEYVEDNPRIELLRGEVEGRTEQGIIWAQYREEIDNIVRAVREAGMRCEPVNGAVPMGQRRRTREAFQAGELQWIVAHPGSMGVGFTLTAASIVYYYSNGFNLEERLQSEDRAHRIGQTKSVLYRDFIAIDTRDDNVVWALQHKLDTAAIIHGDPERQSRFGSIQKGRTK